MHKIALIATAVAAMAAAPAYAAGEGRIEARGGIAFANGDSEAIAGIGGGYDFDLGKSGFIGLDLGADKLLVGGTKVVFSTGARVGGRVGEKTKLYANAGIGFCCGTSDFYAGAGVQQKFGEKLYGKLEYRRILGGSDVNSVQVGRGFAF